MASPDRADVYTRITNEIIAAIESGPGEWQAPWHHDGSSIARPINLSSAKRYRGINTVALWVAAMNSGYVDGLWGTYRQWAAAGAQVRKGERAMSIGVQTGPTIGVQKGTTWRRCVGVDYGHGFCAGAGVGRA